MKRLLNVLTVTLFLIAVPMSVHSETIDVFIKGTDDGVKSSKQQDYKEAVMNAELEAFERAGVEISSITKLVNFRTKYDIVESKAEVFLLPGFQIMDIGYQANGKYAVVLSGKIKNRKEAKVRTREDELALQKEIFVLEDRLASVVYIISKAEYELENRLKDIDLKTKEMKKECKSFWNMSYQTECLEMLRSAVSRDKEQATDEYNRKTEGLAEEQVQLRLRLSELSTEFSNYPPSLW